MGRTVLELAMSLFQTLEMTPMLGEAVKKTTDGDQFAFLLLI